MGGHLPASRFPRSAGTDYPRRKAKRTFMTILDFAQKPLTTIFQHLGYPLDPKT
jgi:hypothetical protein